MNTKQNPIRNALLGAAIGDALGVPVEFTRQADLDKNPVKTMRGYGTYHQPPGTWSDDTSLLLCLAESLLEGYDLADIAKKCTQWVYENRWTARGDVFDIGLTTSRALERLSTILRNGKSEELATLRYDSNVRNNGNGALMRILPLLFYVKDMDLEQMFEIVQEVACLTHAHIRSSMACFMYLILAKELLEGKEKFAAYHSMKKTVNEFFTRQEINPDEQEHFKRILQEDISLLKRPEILSGGYVIESIEASIWCLLQSTDYPQTVLLAVNLGHDTDTTAAIAGGLAGLAFGLDSVPEMWMMQLARLEDIEQLADGLAERFM